MGKRLVVVLDITGLQSEEMRATPDIIRALHNRAIYYSNLNIVSVEDLLEKVYENEVEL